MGGAWPHDGGRVTGKHTTHSASCQNQRANVASPRADRYGDFLLHANDAKTSGYTDEINRDKPRCRWIAECPETIWNELERIFGVDTYYK